MNEKEIGEHGRILNFSMASRAMNIDPDKAQIEKYDEYSAKGNPIQYLFIPLSILALGLSVYLFIHGHWVLGLLAIVLTLFLALLAYSFGNATLKKEIAYKDGLLILAIISNTSPLEIIALAPMGTREDQDIIYGCIKRRSTTYPVMPYKLMKKYPV